MNDLAIEEVLTRGVVNIIPNKTSLKNLLLSGKKLNIYLGIDPTATRLHIGHAVPLRRLQNFVDLSHNVTFLIGDFTTLIGDTSDKNAERPILTKTEIQKNFETYEAQASKFIDFTKVNLKYNSEWLGKLGFEDIVSLSQNFSVGDFISRELIRDRLDAGTRVRLDEMLYPIMQGYDSYFMDTDIQLGAADQTFNMQAGRTLQKNLRNKESYILVFDYLIGTDGRKMSKSLGNAIWITDSPEDMYGKVMSLKDDLIEQYLILATSLNLDVIDKLITLSKKDPMTAKKHLAHRIVLELHSKEEANIASDKFKSTIQDKELPEDILNYTLKSDATIIDVLVDSGLTDSKSESKRLLAQNAVEIDGEKITDPTVKPSSGILKVGKRSFRRLIDKT